MVRTQPPDHTPGMATEAGIAVGCTSCGKELFLADGDEGQVHAELTGFFAEHGRCDVFVDVSRASVPLPRTGPG